MGGRQELQPGAYSAFVLHEGGTWEQPTYRVPAGWTENELRRALEAESRKVLRVTGICEDPDAEEDVLRSLPDVEIEPDHQIVASPEELMMVAVVSTLHLSAAEGQRKSDAWPCHCHESEFGFVVHVAVDFAEVLGDDVDQWPGLIVAARWAVANGLEWVRFDADGPLQPGLTSWEW